MIIMIPSSLTSTDFPCLLLSDVYCFGERPLKSNKAKVWLQHLLLKCWEWWLGDNFGLLPLAVTPFPLFPSMVSFQPSVSPVLRPLGMFKSFPGRKNKIKKFFSLTSSGLSLAWNLLLNSEAVPTSHYHERTHTKTITSPNLLTPCTLQSLWLALSPADRSPVLLSSVVVGW